MLEYCVDVSITVVLFDVLFDIFFSCHRTKVNLTHFRIADK